MTTLLFLSRIALVMSLLANSVMAQKPADKPIYLFIGTYTSGQSEGIYVYTFDPATGQLAPHSKATDILNPSFLALSPNRKFLYAVSESAPDSRVYSFALDAEAGTLTSLNYQPSGGGGPCHVTVDKTGRWVLVGNYGGGNLSVLPVGADGRLAAPVQTVQHSGKGANASRQEKPHVHQVPLAANNRDLFVPDLGIDQLVAYKFDEKSGRLNATPQLSVALSPGGGPRHLTFHPDKKFAYVIQELSGTITALTYQLGKLAPIQIISAMPPGATEDPAGADIHVSPDGRFLYASLRGNNTLAIFAIDPKTGRLTYRQSVSTGGKHPRNFTLDPSGRFVLVANRDSNSITVFRRDAQTGGLTPVSEATVPTPTCLVF
jgi:6-phosphogluconolactonase